MKTAHLNDIDIHYRDDGPKDGPAVVFANSLGTDMRMWEPILPLLPPELRIIRYDKRGHGLSACPPAPYSMGALIKDAESLIDHLRLKDVVFVGLSIGGLIAQGLTVKRPDLFRAVVLSNTAAKIGTQEMWKERIDAVKAGGIASISDAILSRWFSRAFMTTRELGLWRRMLEAQPDTGYVGCCAAIAGTDFMTTTAKLTLPLLAIAGSEDGSTPPDLVRETAALVDGSRFELVRGGGHLPHVEEPHQYADLLIGFLKETGHLS